jgi:tRNA dimethylallyltransferase
MSANVPEPPASGQLPPPPWLTALTPGRHLAIVGPTASGKSSLALATAVELGDAEIVSLDSMCVYRHMNIGTAKPTPADQALVPHHLLDLVDPSDEYTVAQFQDAFAQVVTDIDRRGRRAVLVGGTGLYLQATVDALRIPGRFPEVVAQLDTEPDTARLHARLAQLDPLAASRIEPTNRRRIVRALEVTLGSGVAFSASGPGITAFGDTPFRLVGVSRPRPALDQRIAQRYEHQMAVGFLDEVRGLLARPGGLSRTARQALGYRELLAHLEGGVDLNEALDTALARTRRFSRRQQRWFRRDPRISWINVDTADEPIAVVEVLDRLRD